MAMAVNPGGKDRAIALPTITSPPGQRAQQDTSPENTESTAPDISKARFSKSEPEIAMAANPRGMEMQVIAGHSWASRLFNEVGAASC